MIHGVYIRSTPKKCWQLASMSISAIVAQQERTMLLQNAINNGNEAFQVAIKTFDSVWFIPESLKEITEESKILFN